LALHD
jgi:hypothetical protein